MILKELETIVLTKLTSGLGKTSLDPDENLLEQGIIDSLGLMKLIVILENTFDVNISDDEIVPDNFQCLNSMMSLIKRQQQVNL
jgi:acyl carrier protein